MDCKKAIVVASFGTSYNDTRAKTIDRIESDIAKAFPDREVRRAFMSKMIIKKLKDRDGVEIDYIDEALQHLVDDGFDDVIVLPTLVFNEFDDIVRISSSFVPKFKSLSIANPLLTEERDFDELQNMIVNDILNESRSVGGTDSVLILMGHGTDHYSNGAFSEIQLKLMMAGFDDILVTTVEGFPRFSDLEKIMEKREKINVVLAPLMLVAGDHALNDMAGDSPNSLKSVMENKGHTVHSLVKGLAEYDCVRKMFIRHITDVMTD